MANWTGIFALVSLVLYGGALACTSTPAKSGPGPRAPIVAPETREASEELFGTQEDYMKVMNQTDSEEAGTRFQNDINKRVPPREEGAK
jgi:hypothetical protein